MSKHKLFTITTRNFSQTLYKRGKRAKYIKYPNIYEEHPRSERNDIQRLINKGRSLAPYNKRLPVTGKNTGPGVEGGSKEALELASLHLVPPVGFVNKRGQFIPVKKMQTEFVVPDLKEFNLKPYVPYDKVPDISKGEHTARELFDAFYAEKVKEKFYSKFEKKEEKKKTLLDKFRKSR